MNVSVSGNAKTSSNQHLAMGLVNTGTIGKKRKNKPQVDVSTPAQDAEQAPPPPKKASVEPSRPSATTTTMERNHGAPSKTKRMDNGAKKHPTNDDSDDASVSANLVHPAKKAKVEKLAAPNRVPIHRSGKIFLNF